MGKILMALALFCVGQDKLPADAQQIAVKADAKLDAAKKAYEKACAEIKAQEVRDLLRVYDAIRKGDPDGAALVKARVDALQAEVAVSVKGSPSVEQWVQGKWVVKGGNYGEVWEFKGDKVIGTGIGDRVGGKYRIEAGNVQVIWDSGLIEWIRVPDPWSDETSALGRIGPMTAKRLK